MTLPVGAVGEALAHTSLAGLGLGEQPGAGLAAASGAQAQPTGALTLATSPTAGAAGGPSVGVATGVGEVQGATAAGSAAGLEGSAGAEGTAGAEGASGGSSGFGAALTQAISSLEQSQQGADGAAQALATGTAANPESAVVTVEDAQLAMQLASQIRNKAVEGVQQLFQTQM